MDCVYNYVYVPRFDVDKRDAERGHEGWNNFISYLTKSVWCL